MDLRFLKAEQDFLEACQPTAEAMARQAYAAGLRHNDLKPFEAASDKYSSLDKAPRHAQQSLEAGCSDLAAKPGRSQPAGPAMLSSPG